MCPLKCRFHRLVSGGVKCSVNTPNWHGDWNLVLGFPSPQRSAANILQFPSQDVMPSIIRRRTFQIGWEDPDAYRVVLPWGYEPFLGGVGFHQTEQWECELAIQYNFNSAACDMTVSLHLQLVIGLPDPPMFESHTTWKFHVVFYQCVLHFDTGYSQRRAVWGLKK